MQEVNSAPNMHIADSSIAVAQMSLDLMKRQNKIVAEKSFLQIR